MESCLSCCIGITDWCSLETRYKRNGVDSRIEIDS